MCSVQAPATTRSSTLHLTLSYVGEMGDTQARPSDVARALTHLGWICRIAYSIGMPASPLPLASIEQNQWLEPRIVLLHYGSPFESITEIASSVLASTSAMSLMIYALKRMWKLPTEFRTYDKNAEARFLEAASQAVEAEMRLDALIHDQELLSEKRRENRRKESEAASARESGLLKDPARLVKEREEARADMKCEDKKLEEDLEVLDADLGWPKGTIQGLDDRADPETGWEGVSAIWLVEEET